MSVAAAFFASKGYTVENTAARKPYDLAVTKDGVAHTVEVKGTASAGDKVILTRGEVEHAGYHLVPVTAVARLR